MVESTHSQKGQINCKDYRFVSVTHSPAFMMNNLTSNDGESFVYINSFDS